MFSYFEFENFQSHKKTRVDLHPGVNTIVGLTDAGKSAMLRGVRWVIENRPSGVEYRSTWGGDTLVTIGLSEGGTVTRGIDKIGGFYKVNETVLRAFGTSVPELVQKTLNVGSINIEKQHDPIFLLSASGGEIARQFNRVAQLDVIDLALANIGSDVRTANTELKQQKTQIAVQEEKLTAFAWLPDAEIAVEALERLEVKRLAVGARANTLKKLSANLGPLKRSLRRTQKMLTVAPLVQEVEEKQTRLIELRKRKNSLQDVLHSINHLRKRLIKTGNILKQEDNIAALTCQITEINEKNKKLKILRSVTKDTAIISQRLKTNAKRIKEKQGQFDELMPEICPLCEEPTK